MSDLSRMIQDVGRPDRADRGLFLCTDCGSRTFKIIQQRNARGLLPIHVECANCEAPQAFIVEAVRVVTGS